ELARFCPDPPGQIDCIVSADDKIIVERLRRRIGVDQAARREAFTVVLGDRIINTRLLFGATQSKPSNMKPAATVTTDARPGVRTGRYLPAVVTDLDWRTERRRAVVRLAQHMVSDFVVVHFPVDHVDCFAPVSESNAQFAAFTQTFPYLIILRERFALRVDFH